MELRTAQTLVDLIENNGEEAELHEDYSGRGMYGDTTSGIVLDDPSQILAAICRIVGEGGRIDNDLKEMAEDLESGFRTDSMGMQTICY
jgi:hypothetical protein